MSKQPTALYIHIPFCSHICHYCDFSKVLIEGQPVDDYINTVIDELKIQKIEKVKTVYIGGGTPTALSIKQLEKLLNFLDNQLDTETIEEFTIEANPSDLSDEMIALLKESSVNRISLGVQTFNNELLNKIGRTHTEEEVYKVIKKLKEAEFDNITIDLIYGLPLQTMEMVKEDIDKLLALDLPHVALYSLILEDHTLFMNQQRRGLLKLPSDDKNADMYEYILDRLNQANYDHYEISNFSKKGYESKHNLTYWDNAEYYGIGAGASGYVDGVRYKNYGPIHHYLQENNKRVYEERLDQKQQIEEEMFLGLRKKKGVSFPNFQKKFGVNITEIYGEVIEELVQQGLIENINNSIHLTEKGFMLGNEVFQAFLLDD